MFKPTKAQSSAIDTRGSVLVTAAAGSGKTAVLVERVISMITGSNPTSIDRLLIVTFTNAAAAEMRQRIEKRLLEEQKKNPQNRHIAKQIMLLPSAQICTIDTFCINLVRENFDAFGIAPDFKIAEGGTLGSLYDAAIKEVLAEYYDNDIERLSGLLSALGANYGDSKLIDAVFSVFEYSRNLPFPNEWLEYARTLYDDIEGNFSMWRGDVSVHKSAFSKAQNSIAEALSLIEENAKLCEKYKETLLSINTVCDGVLSAIDSDDADKALFLCDSLEVPTVPVRTADNAVPAARKARADFLTACEEIVSAFSVDEKTAKAQLKVTAPYIQMLLEIVEKFANRLYNLQCDKNIFTFYNTEQMALELLCQYSDGKYYMSDFAKELFTQFDEVLVDEYQDVNDLQDTLFSLVSGYGEHLFAVGDVKQSIYGFRGANPANFVNKKDSYIPLHVAKEDDKKKIVLSSNFRSRKGVCGFVNYFCSLIMSRNLGGVDYNEEEYLNAAAEYMEKEEPDVEMHILSGEESEDDNPLIEAKHIAAYIKNAVKKGISLRAEYGTRTATYGDFAILLRSPGTHSDVYLNELQKLGIPARFETGGFINSQEVSLLLALLKVIGNPTHDVPLLALMMSQLFAFSPDDVARVRLCDRKGSLYSALITAAKGGNKKAEDMLNALRKFRHGAITRSVEGLISWLFEETGLLDFVSAMDDGERRRNNLLLCLDYAKNYESDGKDIRGFVAYMEKIGPKVKTPSGKGGENAVNIVSFHGSKGLQYPICIIAGAFHRFNDMDTKKALVMDRKLGVAFKMVDAENNASVDTIARKAIISKMKASLLSEELRVMYVALTRAEEKLIVLLTSANPKKRALAVAEKIKNGEDKAFVSSVSGYFDWFMYALLRLNTASNLRELFEIDLEEKFIKSEKDCAVSFLYTALEDNAGEVGEIECETDVGLEEIKKRFEFLYPYDKLREIKSKTSVSDIVHGVDTNSDYKSRPAFASKSGLTPAERGTATHKFMQFADYAKAAMDLESETERLIEKEFLSVAEADAIDKIKIGEFLESTLFARMENALDVHRELRFLSEFSQIPEYPAEKTVVQGIIDCVIEESDGIVVVDFKTDNVTDEQTLIERYSKQLDLYARACEKMFSLPVKEKIIYSFALSKSIKL